jgi:L,D-peptidoglycan transpeptidase YkuD (ErfK/YbiS/YcfS/YnhG family)
MHRRHAALVFVAALFSFTSPPALAQTCPPPLASATRLVVVTTAGWTSVAANIQRHERAGPGEAWRANGPAMPGVVGLTGMGWAWSFENVAKTGEPVKREGDKRTPAGIFSIGQGFGIAASGPRRHLKLQAETTYCVDDVRSAAYNTIVPMSSVPKGTSGEKMWSEPLYKRGVVIDHPTNAAVKGGSCVFLHLWRDAGKGTAGCVALSESNLIALQDWLGDQPAAIAILPAAERGRFGGCLPAQ